MRLQTVHRSSLYLADTASHASQFSHASDQLYLERDFATRLLEQRVVLTNRFRVSEDANRHTSDTEFIMAIVRNEFKIVSSQSQPNILYVPDKFCCIFAYW